MHTTYRQSFKKLPGPLSSFADIWLTTEINTVSHIHTLCIYLKICMCVKEPMEPVSVLETSDFPPLGLILQNSILVPLRAQVRNSILEFSYAR